MSFWLPMVFTKYRFFILLLPLVLLLALGSSRAVAGLPHALVQVLERHDVPQDAVSLWVQSPGVSPSIAHRVDVPRNPASTMKLVTTLAALDILGPSHRWETRLYTFAPVESGVLKGDLYVRGGGDPFLVSEEVWKLAGALRRSGIERIEGDLIFDLSHYDVVPEDPGDFDGRPFRAYNQPPHALLMNFNAVRFEFRPGEDGRSVQVTTDPPLSHLQLDNRLRLAAGPCEGYQRGVAYHVEDSGRVRLEGRFPQGCEEYSLLRTALGPEAYAHSLFTELWGQWGGTLEGYWRTGTLPDEAAEPRVVHRSPPLGDLIRLINKYSNNVMARQLKLALGVAVYEGPATVDKGHAAIRAMLARNGVDTQGLELDNAAGLSRSNRMTARQLAQVLQVGRNSPYMPEYLSSLAISGEDGTLRRRFVDAPGAGDMRLKTGYLNGVSAVAGYMRTARGEERMVVLMINHPGLQHWRGTRIQDGILDWLYANG
ncbi:MULTISPECIES: D-alanyl-D-alanine carboxypeptidase/D-alanyl-D-alanine-endopeptidase [unclassified Ectothiorhodospira]|uniref:D-alanyl-D-alanine carboxypeptidase/D-alanyl-D-alanine endopeptidase n=1 Tax=unclassified Ectothiorhodospira TaxID=2684909 RepID=UPI001EE86627|nr:MULTISPECIES: D-alanyl-D-alanine carboxypeptidase/D-alanyl-D-alanine-endopeptidase [unclassified Ectothiorhodospira]MCG5514634.1 D-alanyl-D-alanine carboxypeptidase/D-alanyl-D-alanine-endopeptidase [Ectothiorhodospira sp. 9100]MCG5517992.1 D-alanyl-D-alanine carboxypeptidase/D-alanyl-D-alanine-endopeptidase [Ectothiorhodospira sp. 9905]